MAAKFYHTCPALVKRKMQKNKKNFFAENLLTTIEILTIL